MYAAWYMMTGEILDGIALSHKLFSVCELNRGRTTDTARSTRVPGIELGYRNRCVICDARGLADTHLASPCDGTMGPWLGLASEQCQLDELRLNLRVVPRLDFSPIDLLCTAPFARC